MPGGRHGSDLQSHRRGRSRTRTRRTRLAIAPWIIISIVAVVGLTGVSAGYAWLVKPSCSGAPVPITVVASPDQSKVLSALAQAWTDQGPSVQGRCGAVEVVTKGSDAVAAALSPAWDPRRDGARPDVWAPDSTAWTRYASARPSAAAMLPDNQPSLARSPVVLAMPRPMAEALGWPKKQIGWHDIATDFGVGSPGWKKFGHPEWGRFQAGMTDPVRSTAGLHALMAITDFNNDGRATDDELKSSLGFSRSITRHAPDTEGMFEQLQKADANGKTLSYISAFPALERDVSDYNASGPKVPLAALYPPEGMADADHPYVVLNALWVDPLRKQIAQEFLTYVLGPQGRAAYADAGFRGPDRSPAPMLTRERGFEPTINAVQRSVLAPEQVTRTVVAWRALNTRANILSVLDVSGSMATAVPGTGMSRLEIAKKASLQAVATFNPETQLGMWVFSTNQTPTSDYRELVSIGPVGGQYQGSTRREAVRRALATVPARGATALYDTSLAAYKRAQLSYQPGRLNLVVVMTDGRNEIDYGLKRDEFMSALRAEVDPSKPVQMLTIAFGKQAAVEDLQKMAEITGGKSFVAQTPQDIQNVFLAALFGR
ncbi:MAG TPA: substrate-binding and VWA domain-containing protein [Mycobacteriales bacterium]|jgi:Ca-activated chloride channel family protein|nr:substrate-binding and VWA domain-containing protein [Mycobacteriales bacterium]